MKKLIAALLLVSAGYASAAEVSGNVALATDYRFRGISQTDRDPAIQGGFDWAHDSGFYVGAWASNVAFGGSSEMDFYGGWAKDLNDNLSVDFGYLYYAYPGDGADPKLDYQELYASLGFYGATVGVNYSDDYFGGVRNFWYLYGDYSLPLGENFSIDAHVAWNVFEDESELATFLVTSGDPGDNYIDYSIGVSTSALGLDFSIAYVGTDVDSEYCSDKLCKGAAVATVSKTL